VITKPPSAIDGSLTGEALIRVQGELLWAMAERWSLVSRVDCDADPSLRTQCAPPTRRANGASGK
jgi:hypothetical protein